MIYLGIDPGLDGGLAILSDEGQAAVYKTPVIGGKDYDIQGMKDLLGKPPKNALALIENQISMPGQGLTSTLQTGKGFGIWLGLLAALNVPYQVISARSWQVKLFTGLKGNLDTKAKSEIIAKRLFPRVDFRKSERSRVANDGLTDAILIAEYGRRIHRTSDEPVTGIPHEVRGNPMICSRCGEYLPTSRANDCKHGTLF